MHCYTPHRRDGDRSSSATFMSEKHMHIWAWLPAGKRMVEEGRRICAFTATAFLSSRSAGNPDQQDASRQSLRCLTFLLTCRVFPCCPCTGATAGNERALLYARTLRCWRFTCPASDTTPVHSDARLVTRDVVRTKRRAGMPYAARVQAP